MRLGVLVRADARGLGFQSRAVCRELGGLPLVVVPSDERAAGYAQQVPSGVPVVEWRPDGSLQPRDLLQDWLRTIDVCWSAETLYDPALVRFARKAGVKTVVHVNPELWRWDWEPPTRVWLPTSWLADRFEGARVVPMPVETDQAPSPVERADPVVLVHTVGRRALLDRNGTEVLSEALKGMGEPCTVRVWSQDATAESVHGSRRQCVETFCGGTEDRWDMYRGAHVLVLPRRYGGNCLPAIEAMAAGLAVVMPDCSPNLMWPVVSFPVQGFRSRGMVGGRVPVAALRPRDLAKCLDGLVRDRERLAEARARSLVWASENSWEALRQVWTDELVNVL